MSPSRPRAKAKCIASSCERAPPGRLVPREELFQAIWGQVVVTDGTLTQCLIEVRPALDDRAQSIVRTVCARGYCANLHGGGRYLSGSVPPEHSQPMLSSSFR